jgi:hypothetical protein
VLVLRAPHAPPAHLPSAMATRSDPPPELIKPVTPDRSLAKAEDAKQFPPAANPLVREPAPTAGAMDYAVTKPPAPMAPMPAPVAAPTPKEPDISSVRRYGLASSTPAPKASEARESRGAKVAAALPAPETRRADPAGPVASAAKSLPAPSAAKPTAAPGTAIPSDRYALAPAASKTKKQYYPETNPAQKQNENARSRFSNVDVRNQYRRNFNSPAALPVLNSFEMEQLGSQVRIVDADGSVYQGPITPVELQKGLAGSRQAVNTPPPLKETQAARKVTAVDAESAQSLDSDAPTAFYNFRAVGTNRTMNQRVVFSGNYIGAANAASQSANNVASQSPLSAANNQAGAGGQMQSNPLRNQGGGGAMVQGQAFIGTNNQVEINALERPGP